MEESKEAQNLTAGEAINLFGEKAVVFSSETYTGVYGLTTVLTFRYAGYHTPSTMRIRGTSTIPLWKD